MLTSPHSLTPREVGDAVITSLGGLGVAADDYKTVRIDIAINRGEGSATLSLSDSGNGEAAEGSSRQGWEVAQVLGVAPDALPEVASTLGLAPEHFLNSAQVLDLPVQPDEIDVFPHLFAELFPDLDKDGVLLRQGEAGIEHYQVRGAPWADYPASPRVWAVVQEANLAVDDDSMQFIPLTFDPMMPDYEHKPLIYIPHSAFAGQEEGGRDAPWAESDDDAGDRHFVMAANATIGAKGLQAASVGHQLSDEDQTIVQVVFVTIGPEKGDFTGIQYVEQMTDPNVRLTLLINGQEVETVSHPLAQREQWDPTVTRFAEQIASEVAAGNVTVLSIPQLIQRDLMFRAPEARAFFEQRFGPAGQEEAVALEGFERSEIVSGLWGHDIFYTSDGLVRVGELPSGIPAGHSVPDRDRGIKISALVPREQRSQPSRREDALVFEDRTGRSRSAGWTRYYRELSAHYQRDKQVSSIAHSRRTNADAGEFLRPRYIRGVHYDSTGPTPTLTILLDASVMPRVTEFTIPVVPFRVGPFAKSADPDEVLRQTRQLHVKLEKAPSTGKEEQTDAVTVYRNPVFDGFDFGGQLLDHDGEEVLPEEWGGVPGDSLPASLADAKGQALLSGIRIWDSRMMDLDATADELPYLGFVLFGAIHQTNLPLVDVEPLRLEVLVDFDARRVMAARTVGDHTLVYQAGQEETLLATALALFAHAAETHPGVLVITQSGLEENPEVLHLARHSSFTQRIVVFGAAAAQLEQLQAAGIPAIREDDFDALVLALLSLTKADRVTVLEEAGSLTQALSQALPPSISVHFLEVGARIRAILSAFLPAGELDQFDEAAFGVLTQLLAA